MRIDACLVDGLIRDQFPRPHTCALAEVLLALQKVDTAGEPWQLLAERAG
ncbi:hypothetical protein ACIRG5_20200 [Lentzea sp. NPDC102401]